MYHKTNEKILRLDEPNFRQLRLIFHLMDYAENHEVPFYAFIKGVFDFMQEKGFVTKNQYNVCVNIYEDFEFEIYNEYESELLSEKEGET